MALQFCKLEHVTPSTVWAMESTLARMWSLEMLNQVFICRKLGVAYPTASVSFCIQMVLRMLVKVFLIV
jgi:hypothetical protein